jgi:hypothetical protein
MATICSYELSTHSQQSPLINQKNEGSVRLFYNPYFHLVFLVGTVFFSHNKSTNSTFSHDFSAKRTAEEEIKQEHTTPPPK